MDVEQLLRRVVTDEVGSAATAAYTPHPKHEHDWSAVLVSEGDPSKSIRIRATYEWFTVHIEDLDVSAIVFEYDDEEGEKESALRELVRVARAYLDGRAEVQVKPGRFGRRQRTSVSIQVDGTMWILGKRTSSVGPA